MHLEHYDYAPQNNFHEYSFQSNGPKGIIDKRVVYSEVPGIPDLFNLAFGDIDPATGVLSDQVKSNNGDRDQVLATVANTIHDFCDRYGNKYIYAQGSTPARTRLYQMGISDLLEEIEKDFTVWGSKEGEWLIFEKGINYEAFLVMRK